MNPSKRSIIYCEFCLRHTNRIYNHTTSNCPARNNNVSFINLIFKNYFSYIIINYKLINFN